MRLNNSSSRADPQRTASLTGSQQHAHHDRTSSNTWIPTAQHQVLQELAGRVAALLGLPPSAVSEGRADDSGYL